LYKGEEYIIGHKGGIRLPTFDSVSVTGDLSVNGKTQLGNDSSDTVMIAGNENVAGNLTVSGNAQLGSSMLNLENL
jgi:hypothetical protein